MVTSPAGKYQLILIVVAFGLSVTFLSYITVVIGNERSLEDAALREGATVIRGEVDGKLVHCYNSKDAPICLANYIDSDRGNQVALWLGNSQLHSINQISLGDQPASALLHEEVIGTGDYVLTFSQANANLQEHLVFLNYFKDLVEVDKLILPIFFDDLRETGVRTSVIDFFKDRPINEDSTEFFQSLINGPRVSAQFDSVNDDNVRSESLMVDLELLEGTPQKIAEAYLGAELSKISTVWKAQSEIRGNTLISLYKLRNFLFGITPSSIRKSIPSRYKKNIEAFKEILMLAKNNKIRTLVYIPPLRDDYKRPYDVNEYNQFKSDIQKITLAHGANFSDLENLVPNRLWGMKDATSLTDDTELELDFMHFQFEGHELLADKLFSLISSDIQLRTQQ